MTTAVRRQASMGGTIMGTAPMTSEFIDTFEYDVADVSGRHRAVSGFGQLGQRILGKGYPWTPFRRSNPSGGSIGTITVTSTSGAILGSIRTDVQKSLLRSLRFVNDAKGCAEFSLTLNALPDFPLLPMSILRINIGNTDFDWYVGIVETAPEAGTMTDEYVYEGFGLRKQLSRVLADGVYDAGVDVGIVVSGIVESIIQPNTSIGFNTGKIDISTGISTVQEQTIQNADIAKLMDSYAKMANARWGVDGDGDFFFERRSTTVIRNLYVGYDCAEFKPVLNIEDVRNRITVTRKFESGTAGWSIGAIAFDLPSQAKYSLREMTVQLPGIYSDNDCEIVADAELEQFKEPKYSGTIQSMPIRSSDDYLERGTYRIVNQPSQFSVTMNDCEDAGDWDLVTSTGQDVLLATDADLMVSGSASIQLTWSVGVGAYISTPTSIRGSIQKIRAWVYCNRAGIIAKFGIGDGSFTQNERDISFTATNAWFLFEWDVSGLNLSNITEIGVTILNDDEATLFRIDQIEAIIAGSRHYYMELDRSSYVFEPNQQIVNVNLGPQPPTLYNYVAEVLARAEENRIAGQRT